VTPSLRALQPFGNGDDLDGTILRAAITRAGTMLSLRWVLRAPADHWRLPGPRPGATRADRLWEHTCFEAFVAPAGGATYWELNPRPTLPIVRGWVREIMGLLYVLHNRRLLHMLDSFRRNAPLRR
jgi:hypothetical protein